MRLGKSIFCILILSITVSFFGGNVAGQSQITTTPGFLDVSEEVGELERGDDIELSYFISVDAERNVTLDIEYSQPLSSRLWEGDFPIENEEYSEEDISEWIDAPDQITVDPSNEVDANFASGNKELVVGIEVPEDAEPGYHAGMIRFRPANPQRGDGFGAGTITSSVPEFMFEVPGDARREIELTDLEAIRTGQDEVQLLATFENTGTVTVSSDGGEADVVNDNDRSEGTIEVDGFSVGPGETTQVDATWSGTEGGVYELEGTVDYITGQAYVGPPEAQFAIAGAVEDAVDINEGSESSEESNNSTPLWIVIMVLVVLGAIMYSMDIDPFWVVLVMGFLTIISLILFTGIPNWALAVVLVLAGILVYL